MSVLPYVTSPGNVERTLKAIQSAATPSQVNQDFVKTILKIPGGSGDQITSYLKKIGFAATDGTPTDIYTKYRNPTTAGYAVADAIRHGYAPLFKRNEFMYELSDTDLKGLIIEETGQSKDSNVVGLVLSCIKALKKFAVWSSPIDSEKTIITVEDGDHQHQFHDQKRQTTDTNELGLNLSYTINLNLPATSDVAVFNAIFKSLKENLLKND